MGWGSKLKKAYTKTMGRGIGSIVGMGKGGVIGYGKGSGWDKVTRELGHGAGYITGANAMEDLIDAQNAANAQAEHNASIRAGNVQQVTDAGTEQALAKILRKSALARSIRTAGQAGGGRQTLG